MGINSAYYAFPQPQIEEFKHHRAAMLAFLEGETEANPAAECKLGVMWDALHFVLTGKGTGHADPATTERFLMQAVVGCKDMSQRRKIVSYADAEQVRKISDSMAGINLELRGYSFSGRLAELIGIGKTDTPIQRINSHTLFRQLSTANIYPPVWNNDSGELEFWRGKIVKAFCQLQEFYKKAAEQNCGVVVYIG